MRALLFVCLLFLGCEKEDIEARCDTDTDCFELCAKEKGRPCTDEEMFGPLANAESDEEFIPEECHPDDTDCHAETDNYWLEPNR